MDKHVKEVKKRWGNTKAYKQSMERTKNWTEDDYKNIVKEGDEISKELAFLMDKNVSDERVQKLVKRHHTMIEKFYDCPKEIYLNLGNIYVEDKRFAANYEKVRPGLALFLKEAIEYFCRNKNMWAAVD